jgi:phytoene dehydrogenase-like protein
MPTHDIIIIGAGHNGLVAAAYLAKAGKKVLVLERREVVGGSVVTEEFAPGFKASPTTDLCGLLLPRVSRDLELKRQGLEILPLDPAVFLPLGNGSHLTLWREREKTLREIERHSTADAQAYPRFAELVQGLTSFMRPVLSRPAPKPNGGSPGNLLELLRIGWGIRRLGTARMHQLFRILPMSVADLLNEWFEGDGLKAALAARGVGGVFLSPRASGSSAVFLYHHLGQPDWPLVSWGLPRGGMGGVSRAMAQAAKANGAEIRTGAPVARIVTKNGRATGVALDNGDEIEARLVVSDTDPRTTFLKLLGPGELETEFIVRVKAIRYRGVVAKINLALAELPNFTCLPGKEPADHHRGLTQIGPEMDYLERAFDDAKYGRFSSRPFLQATIPSLTDPGLAPKGQHVMSVLMQYAPYHLREGSWAERKDALGDTVVDTLNEYAPNLKQSVLHRQVLTPLDLEETYGLPEGNLHQGDLALDQLFFMRPVPGWARYRTPVPNLYLCGAATHPGGGVTGAPGYNASRQILKDWSKVETKS